jgi:hypothetical protein
MSVLRNLAVGLFCGAALGGATMADEFATRAAAKDYISAALPKATSENPKYLTKNDGTVSEWLTEEVRFASDGAGAVTVEMRERYTQTKDGKTTPGKHEAAFSLAAVKISDFSAPYDVTPQGAAARGLLFACAEPGCVSAVWGGQPSRADKADIYIQSDETRAKILAAFRRLQSD